MNQPTPEIFHGIRADAVAIVYLLNSLFDGETWWQAFHIGSTKLELVVDETLNCIDVRPSGWDKPIRVTQTDRPDVLTVTINLIGVDVRLVAWKCERTIRIKTSESEMMGAALRRGYKRLITATVNDLA